MAWLLSLCHEGRWLKDKTRFPAPARRGGTRFSTTFRPDVARDQVEDQQRHERDDENVNGNKNTPRWVGTSRGATSTGDRLIRNGRPLSYRWAARC